MAGIGDYIHYKKENYLKYGITKDTPSQGVSLATKAFNAQRKRIRREFPSSSSTNLQSLEQFLNALMYGKEKDSKYYDEQAIQELQKIIEKEFQKKFPKLGLNFDMGVYYKGTWQIENKDSISISVLNKHLNNILIKTNDAINFKKDANIDSIRQSIYRLQEDVNKISKNKKIILLKNNSEARGIIDQINELLKMQSIPYQKAIGDVFEMWLALASQYAEGIAIEKADEIINELVKGHQGSNTIVSLNNFSEDYVDKDTLISSFPSGWNPINNNTEVKFNKPTQDKLDVVFNWKGDSLKVSAKNYKLADSGQLIHLLNGTSLLTLISGENSDFVNHWLNCISSGGGNLSQSIIQQAHIAMKLTIFMKALTGQGTSAKTNVADTFILNHRTHKKIYVRNMKNILNAIENTVSGDTIRGAKISNYPSQVYNQWNGDSKIQNFADAKTRITNLLVSLHSYNISVSMSSSIFV